MLMVSVATPAVQHILQRTGVLCRFGDVLASFLILQKVTPVTHSVGNCVKRVVCTLTNPNVQPSVYPLDALLFICRPSFRKHAFGVAVKNTRV